MNSSTRKLTTCTISDWSMLMRPPPPPCSPALSTASAAAGSSNSSETNAQTSQPRQSEPR